MRSLALLAMAPLAMGFAPSLVPGKELGSRPLALLHPLMYCAIAFQTAAFKEKRFSRKIFAIRSVPGQQCPVLAGFLRHTEAAGAGLCSVGVMGLQYSRLAILSFVSTSKQMILAELRSHDRFPE